MSDELLRVLFESSPDAVLLVDERGNLQLVNPRVEALLGYRSEDLIGKPVETLVPDAIRSQHVALRQRFLHAPAIRPMGAGRFLRARRRDGVEIPVEIMLSPVTSDGATSVVATIRDASEHQRALQRLAASETLFKTLFDQAPDAMITVDRGGNIARVNHQTAVLLGYEPDELLGRPIEILVPERLRAAHLTLRDSYLSQPKTRTMGASLDLFARRKDGSEVPVDIMLSALHVEDDEQAIAVIRDVSERRRHQLALKERAEELARSNKELEMFAYVASHDLQEPLRTVASSCQMLERRLAGKVDDDAKEFLQFAVDGAKRMRELIEDLLAYSRISSRGRKLADVRLDELLRRALANLQAAVADTGAVIVVADDLPTIHADASLVTQLLQNLVGNAIKFRRPDRAPQVEISARLEGDRWSIQVKDNGIGMDPRHHARIFTMFQRLHSRQEYPGTGIGLAICKKIVEHHGGAIQVESTPGAGSTFTFTLPSPPATADAPRRS